MTRPEFASYRAAFAASCQSLPRSQGIDAEVLGKAERLL